MLGLIALAVLAVLPAAAQAEDLYFRNDTSAAIIVQGSCLDNRGRVVTGPPNLLKPGDKARVSLPGNKLIIIRQARAPNRMLHKANVPGGMEDQYILIAPDPVANLKLERTTAKEFNSNKK